MIELPLLRRGREHASLDTRTLHDLRTGEPIAEVSQAIPPLIGRDLDSISGATRVLDGHSSAELIEVVRRAARIFAEDTLPLGPGNEQTPDDYLDQLAATTGMPLALGRLNLARIRAFMEGIDEVLFGLTRGLDPAVLDRGWGEQDGHKVAFQRMTDSLGAVLPNNAPGVHNLWVPAIPLKVPLVLRPGSREPWTPWRLIQSLIAAGAPREAFSFYPSGHEGGTAVLIGTGRSMFFGDASTVESWKGEGRVSLHGPGWSKVILGREAAEDWERHLPLMVESVSRNGGRSCINASGIWTAAHGDDIASALAEELAKLEPHPLHHPDARISAWPEPEVADAIDGMIDAWLGEGGAEDVSARFRSGDRRRHEHGLEWLLPTVIRADGPDHPFASAEFTFPFATVVEVEEDRLLDTVGPTLVGTVIGSEELQARALRCRSIDRLNLGPVPTYHLTWDQPHEGNLFDHLYQQRAFQWAS